MKTGPVVSNCGTQTRLNQARLALPYYFSSGKIFIQSKNMALRVNIPLIESVHTTNKATQAITH
jgi:hypothetical protein